MFRRFKILLPILTLFILAACRKEKCPDPAQFLIADETRPYFDILKQGNWWSYRRSSDNQSDSLYITSSQLTFDLNEYECRKTEERHATLKSTYYDSAGFYIHYSGDVFGTEFQISNHSFGVTFDTKTEIFSKFSTIDSLTRLSTLVIGSTTYHDVFECISNVHHKKVYWARGVGIIRWIKTTTTGIDTFNLKNYSLI